MAKRFAHSADRDRLVQMWRQVLNRFPNDQELSVMQLLLKEQRASYRTSVDARELFAWTNVASALLNLDEAITRE